MFQVRPFSEVSIFRLSHTGYADVSWVLWAFFGHVNSTLKKTEALARFCYAKPYCHSHLQWHWSTRCLILGPHGSLRYHTHFFERPAGHSRVLSPFSITELFQAHSLSPASTCCSPASKISVREEILDALKNVIMQKLEKDAARVHNEDNVTAVLQRSRRKGGKHVWTACLCCGHLNVHTAASKWE